MRELKFRAWDIENKKYDFFTMGNIVAYKEVFTSHLLNGNTFEQYTGLKDKNGKEIYEGDKLTNTFETTFGDVIFEDGCFMNDCSGLGYKPFCEEDMNRIEVIGNIHEGIK